MSYKSVSHFVEKEGVSGIRFYPDNLPEVIGDSKLADEIDISEIRKILRASDLEDNIQKKKFFGEDMMMDDY